MLNLVKVTFMSIKECEEVQIGVLPSGTWLFAPIRDEKVDNRAIIMNYSHYVEFCNSLECYEHILIRL